MNHLMRAKTICRELWRNGALIRERGRKGNKKGNRRITDSTQGPLGFGFGFKF